MRQPNDCTYPHEKLCLNDCEDGCQKKQRYRPLLESKELKEAFDKRKAEDTRINKLWES